MVASLPSFEFAFGAAEAVSVDGLAGWTLTSVNTRVWLTEENGGREIWLLPGDRHLVAGAGRVVIESWPLAVAGADLPARIRLAPPVARVGNKWRLPALSLRRAALAWT